MFDLIQYPVFQSSFCWQLLLTCVVTGEINSVGYIHRSTNIDLRVYVGKKFFVSQNSMSSNYIYFLYMDNKIASPSIIKSGITWQ